MAVNDRQEGGSHYMTMEYQHWDWATDIALPYLLGCATKYVARHRKKNGAEDVRKAIHYLEKADERGVRVIAGNGGPIGRFASQLHPVDAAIVTLIALGHTAVARRSLEAMLESYPAHPVERLVPSE